jgi:predicted TIM-barrel fold metal-dependent hydrolase
VKFILIRQGCCQGRRILPLLQKRSNVYFTVERMLDHLQLEELEEKVLCHRLLFGSSYPERPYAGLLGLVLYANISAASRDRILHQNWEELQ